MMLTLAGAVVPSAHATGVGIQPANVELIVKPGSSVRRTIKLANLRTDKSQQFIVGLADWTLDDNGQLKLIAPDATSAAAWVRFAPATFTLKAAESQDIVVDIAVPAKLPAAREFHMAILVTNPTPSPEEMKKLNGVWNQVQVASLFYLTPPGAKPKPVISAMALETSPPAGAFVNTGISNEGTAHARLIAQFKITDVAGKVVHSADAQTVLLPGQKRIWRANLNADQLDGGKYDVNWKMYTVFDPDRPNERVGELMQEKTWTWTKPNISAPKPAKSSSR
ncbi:MAG: hypothetical protein ABI790_07715 [Betaproteobacteria bacterium]